MSGIAVATEDSSSSPANKDWTNRLKAYTEWLNLQLKKYPNSRKITDLRNDLQDGIAIAQLVEALGGGPITGINQSLSSPNIRKENVERIFQHFTTNKVHILNCRVKDVLAGDAKCIMRLIHAVASHYRPESVLNPPAVSNNLTNVPRVGKLGNDVLHHNHHARCSGATSSSSSSLPCTTANNRDGLSGMKSTSSSSSSLGRQKPQLSSVTKKPGVSSALPVRKQPLSLRDSSKSPSISGVSIDNKRSPLRKSFTSLTAERLHRKNLLGTGSPNAVPKEAPAKISCKVAPLQHSIKNGAADLPELHSFSSFSKLNRKKPLVSRSEPCSLDSVDMKNIEESVNLEEKIKEKSEKTCSCSSLTDAEIVELLKEIQEAKNQLLILQDLLLHGSSGKFMKNAPEIEAPYRRSEEAGSMDISNQQVLRDSPVKEFMNNNNNANKRGRNTEPLSMVKKLLSYVSVCGDRKSSDVEDTKPKPSQESSDFSRRNFKEENDVLRKTIQDKEVEIRRLKVVLSQMGSYDKKIKYPYNTATTQTQREELQVVHEALTSLRKCFPANDPYQHTLDTIEQSLSALLERVNCLEIGVVPPQTSTMVASRVPGLATRGNNCETINDSFRKPYPKASGFNAARHEDSRNTTKVVYYMDKSVTPFRCVLNRRIGEATLRDFKLLFDRPGQYRYHFKTLDPEFGMVKEEVLHDDDVLPGWDGKIIAWIEEDCS